MRNWNLRALTIVALVVIGCRDGHGATGETRTDSQTAEPSHLRNLQLVTDYGIELYSEVVESNVRQIGATLFLELTVVDSCPQQTAKVMGGRLVRMVKSFSSDLGLKKEPSPGKFIGSGSYEYRVTVRNASGLVLARGGKLATAQSTWWE